MKIKVQDRLFSRRIKTPVGHLTLVAHRDSLLAVLWENEKPGRIKLGTLFATGRHPVLDEAARQLFEYFEGKRTHFDLRCEFNGTAFQTRVWSALLKIPYGETTAYSSLAVQIGTPLAYRAVGSANGKNPLSIIVPCHRVISKDGGLSGFAGGSEVKSYLVEFEKRNRHIQATKCPV